jgi:low temperature requirement protein LtrA
MKQTTNKQKMYQGLAAVFGIGGLVWIIGGFISHHLILYPFLGLVNWALAFFCWQESQNG